MSKLAYSESIDGKIERSAAPDCNRTHTREKHRSQPRVIGLVREALELLGGMRQFVHAGNTVLITVAKKLFAFGVAATVAWTVGNVYAVLERPLRGG